MPARPGESEEEYRARKEAERARDKKEKRPETEEERAARKAKERERDERDKKDKPRETEEERAERKARERARDDEKRERRPETEEERAARKAKERERDERDKKDKHRETEEERAERKARERREDEKREKRPETEEERAARKAKERERDERDKKDKPRETEEERAERKAKERARDEEKSKKEVVRVQAQTVGSVHKPSESSKGASAKPEPKVQARPSPPKPSETKEAKDVEDEDDDDDDYADDDFVDAYEAEQLEKARKAVEEENARLRREAQASKSTNATASGAGKHATSGASSVPEIAGTSAISADELNRQKYRGQFEKDLQRAQALRRIVDLESVSSTIADIAPLSEYDMYIRSFGGTGRSQASVQVPHPNDLLEAEVQAERVHTRAKAAQCPEDLGLFPERQAALQTQTGGDDEAQSKSSAVAQSRYDTATLASFLTRVFPVIRTLMDESDAARGAAPSQHRQASTTAFSSTVTTFDSPLVEGRTVADLCFSAAAPQYMLALHGPQQRPGAPLAQYPSVALLWNANDPSAPDKVLVCAAPLTSVCCSPMRPHLIYGGTASGSVCVWDLREPNFRHPTEHGCSIRLPSFSTEWLVDNHDAPVVQVQVAGYNAIVGNRTRDEAEQLVSVDSRGNALFWLVSEDAVKGAGAGGSAKGSIGSTTAGSKGTGPSGGSSAGTAAAPTRKAAAAAAISETEHGLNLFATIRLFKASALALLPASSRFDTVRCIDFFPADATQMVAGSSSEIAHVNRYGSLTAPSAYVPYAKWSQTSARAGTTAMHFSPIDSRVLVGGYEDGSLRVFLADTAEPKLISNLSDVGASIARIRCSGSVKWLIGALDETGTFYILDVAKTTDKEAPTHKVSMSTPNSGRCTVFDFSPAERIEPRAIFGFENGTVQLHVLPVEKLRTTDASSRNERWA